MVGSCWCLCAGDLAFLSGRLDDALFGCTPEADLGRAVWASTAARLDPWTARYVGAAGERGRLAGFYPDWLPIQFLKGAAPLTQLAPPEAQLLENATAGDVR